MQEVESRPVQVAVQEDKQAQEEIKKLKTELKQAKKSYSEEQQSGQEKQELKQKLEQAETAEPTDHRTAEFDYKLNLLKAGFHELLVKNLSEQQNLKSLLSACEDFVKQTKDVCTC